MKRIEHTQRIAPNGIYARETRTYEGYRPSASSRFCAVRRDEASGWQLVHVRSGAMVDSLLPVAARKPSLALVLRVAHAFDAATHLDWSDFDALPEVTATQGITPRLSPTPRMQKMALELRDIAVTEYSR